MKNSRFKKEGKQPMSPIREELVETVRSARYYVAGDMAGDAESGVGHIWMLFHGYGQLARDFLEDCLPLLSEGVLLVAPEGLSRFYHRSGRGSIGASWMTSEDRLREIDDYIRYLDGIFETLTGRFDPVPRLSVLGFSQGGATAMRWGIRGRGNPERIVLWGAAFPEAEIEEYRERLQGKSVLLVEGENDRIVSAGEIAATGRKLQQVGVDLSTLRHAGGHELDSPLLSELSLL